MDDVRLLQPLIAKFGARRVWEEGMEFFGYPVTLDLDISQVLSLRQYLDLEGR